MHHIRFAAAAPVSRPNVICHCETTLWSFHVTSNVKKFVPSVKLRDLGHKRRRGTFEETPLIESSSDCKMSFWFFILNVDTSVTLFLKRSLCLLDSATN